MKKRRKNKSTLKILIVGGGLNRRKEVGISS